ncbi:hypothetical protein OOT46_03825 [Aquabacterium sp. A7-Y]|uniref:hypothetical protein n=1 Tax=Aquabacterium sp. A7-Y TaxID=1349605 RepID=UPI00223E2C8F|nr:hypothetical protein [Aquabacterium sp. A7-Y]MCW7536982.1 hypothetical protein [Aquabacterium sp. A7-Y]
MKPLTLPPRVPAIARSGAGSSAAERSAFSAQLDAQRKRATGEVRPGAAAEPRDPAAATLPPASLAVPDLNPPEAPPQRRRDAAERRMPAMSPVQATPPPLPGVGIPAGGPAPAARELAAGPRKRTAAGASPAPPEAPAPSLPPAEELAELLAGRSRGAASAFEICLPDGGEIAVAFERHEQWCNVFLHGRSPELARRLRELQPRIAERLAAEGQGEFRVYAF